MSDLIALCMSIKFNFTDCDAMNWPRACNSWLINCFVVILIIISNKVKYKVVGKVFLQKFLSMILGGIQGVSVKSQGTKCFLWPLFYVMGELQEKRGLQRLFFCKVHLSSSKNSTANLSCPSFWISFRSGDPSVFGTRGLNQDHTLGGEQKPSCGCGFRLCLWCVQ